MIQRLLIPALIACATFFSSCEAVQKLDAPSVAAVKAEAYTFEAIAPAIVTFIASDLARPIEARSTPPDRQPPNGRSDAELSGLLTLVDSWRFRLNANATAAGAGVQVELPDNFEAAKAAARPLPIAGGGQ